MPNATYPDSDDHWAQRVAFAQREIGRFQQRQTLAYSAELRGGEHPRPLMQAARLLHEASGATDNPATAARLVMLSACAYAMYADFAGAGAALRRLPDDMTLTPLETVALCICDPTRIPDAADIGGAPGAFLDALADLMRAGTPPSGIEMMPMLERLMLEATTPLEGVLLRSARLALKHLLDGAK
jgi:hypothetical protein